MTQVFLVILLGIVLIVLGCFVVAMTLDMVRLKAYIPPVPTSGPAIREIIKTIRDHQKTNMKVYDLGCGDGRILGKLAREFPNATYIGYELAYLPRIFGHLWYSHTRKKNIHLHAGDLFQADLSDADIVIAYLFPNVMQEFSNKLSQELRPGSLVISVGFKLPGKNPTHVMNIKPTFLLTSKTLYVYTIV